MEDHTFTESERHANEAMSNSDNLIEGDELNRDNSINYAPDEEDLTSDANDLLKFKDRSSTNGKGYVILRQNLSFCAQVENRPNTIFEIRYNFEIDGYNLETKRNEVTISDGCILKFTGGKLLNGTVIANDVTIDASPYKIFDSVRFEGNICDGIFKLEWFVGTYLTKFSKETPLCAADEIEAALVSGIANISVGYDRYYPVRRTISYYGDVNIIAENNERILRTEGRTDSRRRPCIYSNEVATLIDYHYSHSANARIREGLCVSGLTLRVNKTYSDLSEKDVPVIRITTENDLWGLHFDCNVSAIDCSIRVNRESEGYYIDTATSSSVYIPSYTGLEIASHSGYATFLRVGGNFTSLFNAIRITKGSASGAWITGLIIDADMNVCLGLVGDSISPVIARGHMQTRDGFPVGNSECFLTGHRVSLQGMVWDLGLTTKGISRCSYAVKITASSSSAGYYSGINPESTVIREDYVNLREDHWNLPNLLNGALSNHKHYMFKDGTVQYLVSGDGENYASVLSSNFFTLYNQHNLFGIPSFTIGNTANEMIQGEQPFYTLISGQAPETTLYFKVRLSGNSLYLSSKRAQRFLFTKFTSGIHSSPHIIVKDSKTDTVYVDQYIRLVPMYNPFWFQRFRIYPSNFDIEITWTMSAGTVSNYLPTIFIPNVNGTNRVYSSESSLPSHPAGSRVYGEPVYLIGHRRPYFRTATKYYDADGFTPAVKKGTTAQRPVFEATDSYAVGFQYFDTTLNKWIYWNGTQYVNMDGTVLSE